MFNVSLREGVAQGIVDLRQNGRVHEDLKPRLQKTGKRASPGTPVDWRVKMAFLILVRNQSCMHRISTLKVEATPETTIGALKRQVEHCRFRCL